MLTQSASIKGRKSEMLLERNKQNKDQFGSIYDIYYNSFPGDRNILYDLGNSHLELGSVNS